MVDQQGLRLAASEARTLNAGANTVKLHLLSLLRCLVWGEMELSMKMGRPCSSGAYSTTEPDGETGRWAICCYCGQRSSPACIQRFARLVGMKMLLFLAMLATVGHLMLLRTAFPVLQTHTCRHTDSIFRCLLSAFCQVGKDNMFFLWCSQL